MYQKIVAYIEKKVQLYKEGNQDYEATVKFLDAFDDIVKKDEYLLTVNNVKSSKENYEKGISCKEGKKYTNALEMFDLVIEPDVQNYNNAQNNIKEVINICFDEISGMISRSEYTDAIDMCKEIEKLNLWYDRNVEARMNVTDSGSPAFIMSFGYIADSWVFIDDIIVDCDGEQFKYNVSYLDATTTIGSENVAEAHSFAHSTYIKTNKIRNLEPLMNCIMGCDNVVIRFKGTRSRDYVIPKSHIEQLRSMWELYNILDENPELISELN